MTTDFTALEGGRSLAPYLQKLRESRVDSRAAARRYWTDVEGWAREMIDWPSPPSFARYQTDEWEALYREGRASARAPRGAGKSFGQAIQFLHFCCTREGSGTPWTAVTTAGSIGQLRRYLWPEIHKWARRLRWDRLGFEWRLGRELGVLHIRGVHGSAEGASPSNEQLLEGAHNDELLFLFDEAKSIPSRAWDACEGAFFNIGTSRDKHGYWRADSTPGNASGRFWEIHRKKRGLENWWTRRITAEEAVEAHMLAPQTLVRMAELWGIDSRMYRNHVQAEFSDRASERSVVPLEWVEAAVERGYDWLEPHVPQESLPADMTRDARTRLWWARAALSLPPLSQVGIDIGSGGPGRDPAAIARRHENIVVPVEVLECDEIQLAGRALQGYRKGAVLVPDAINAASLVRRLQESGERPYVAPCNSALPSNRKDSSGQITLLNIRSEMWWAGREQLDPAQGATLILPEDATLMGELTEPEWEETAGGKVKVEDKREVGRRVRKQAGREDEGGSTNRADAVLMACWPRAGGAGQVEAVAVQPRRERAVWF